LEHRRRDARAQHCIEYGKPLEYARAALLAARIRGRNVGHRELLLAVLPHARQLAEELTRRGREVQRLLVLADLRERAAEPRDHVPCQWDRRVAAGPVR